MQHHTDCSQVQEGDARKGSDSRAKLTNDLPRIGKVTEVLGRAAM